MGVPTEWSVPVHELPPGASAKFPLLWRGRRVEAFVINVRGRFYAYVNYCVHAGTPLDWWPNEFFTEDGRFLICATHGALYEPETGACAGGPCAGGRLYRLRVHVEGDQVRVAGEDATDE